MNQATSRSILLNHSTCALVIAVAGLHGACSSGDGGSGGSGSSSSSVAASSASSASGSASASSAASSSSSSGVGGGGGGDDLAGLSDTFDGPALDPAWKIVNPSVVNVQQKGGALSLAMTKPAFWFAAGIGTLAYKLVTGDFKVTSTVHARKAAPSALPPDKPIHVGGLMARDPHGVDQGGKESYVFADVGFAEKGVLAIEYKHTDMNNSLYDEIPWSSGDAEIRLCRVKDAFSLYARPPGGGAFQLVKAYTAVLPAEVQVGLDASCANDTDLVVSFDEVTFARVTTQADCTQ